jgi:hypothetical protein
MMPDDLYDGEEITSDELAELDEQFSETSYDDIEGPPDGRYIVRVVSVKLTRSRAGHPMLRWELEILGPTQIGAKVFRNNMWGSEANIKWLKRDLHVCGVDLGKFSDLPGRLADLLDVVVEVTVRTKDDNKNVRIIRRVEAPPDSPDAVNPAIHPF